MGLDFGKSSMGNPAQAGNGLQEKNEIEVVEKYDIVADRQQMNAELVNSKEVDDIVSTIEVYNMDTIVSFGAKAAEEISKASDVVLNSMNMSQLNETSEMLKSLAKIMDQFDINEIKDNPGLFGKLFGKTFIFRFNAFKIDFLCRPRQSLKLLARFIIRNIAEILCQISTLLLYLLKTVSFLCKRIKLVPNFIRALCGLIAAVKLKKRFFGSFIGVFRLFHCLPTLKQQLFLIFKLRRSHSE